MYYHHNRSISLFTFHRAHDALTETYDGSVCHETSKVQDDNFIHSISSTSMGTSGGPNSYASINENSNNYKAKTKSALSVALQSI